MLHCARECNSRVAENHITFGEFCVFATELRRYYANHERDPTAVLSLPSQISKVPEKRKKGELRTQRSTTSAYDIFLGGSCNPTTWRQDQAIPHFKGKDITFYNPQQANWSPEMIELEHQAKVTSQILFYVLNDQTRNVASMIEVSQYAGSNRRLIVVLNPYPGPQHTINGEQLTKVRRARMKSKTAAEKLQSVTSEDLQKCIRAQKGGENLQIVRPALLIKDECKYPEVLGYPLSSKNCCTQNLFRPHVTQVHPSGNMNRGMQGV